MNDSALNTETRLPRQVKARADRARALLTPNPEQQEQVTANPEPAPAPAVESPTPAPAAADPRENDPVYWKQRFKVTEGMWRRDKERWEGERTQLVQENETLRARVRELEVKAAATASPADVDPSEFFTVEEIETLGEDQARIQAKALKAAQARVVAKVEEEQVAPLRNRDLEEQRRADADRKATFLDKLTELVPHWQDVNANANWLAWLEEDDPTTGIWRQTILDNHQARGRADKVAEMIRAWEAEAGVVRTPGDPNTVPTGRSGGQGQAAVQVASVKGPPSKAEIRDFYKRKALGRVKPEEAAEFDARLKAAGLL